MSIQWEEVPRWTNSDVLATITAHEKKLREQIAQEILEWAQKYQDNPIVENCVRIARGQE